MRQYSNQSTALKDHELSVVFEFAIKIFQQKSLNDLKVIFDKMSEKSEGQSIAYSARCLKEAFLAAKSKGDESSYIHMISGLMDNRMFETAVEAIDIAEKENPRSAEITYLKISCLSTLKQYEKATSTGEKALNDRIEDKSGDIAVITGYAYEKLGENSKAQELYTQASRNNPSNMDAFLQLGNLCYKNEKYVIARKALEQARNLAENYDEIEIAKECSRKLKTIESARNDRHYTLAKK